MELEPSGYSGVESPFEELPSIARVAPVVVRQQQQQLVSIAGSNRRDIVTRANLIFNEVFMFLSFLRKI